MPASVGWWHCMLSTNLDRRTLLLGSLASAAGSLLPVRARAEAETVRVGVLGTGARGGGLIPVLGAVPGLEVTALCDVLPFRLAAAAETAAKVGFSDVSTYDEAERLYDDPEVDAILLATPLSMHHQMALEALDAGKHLYCEKTMTLHAQEALDVVRWVEGSDRVVQVGYQYRYHPVYLRVAELVREGWLGEVTQVDLEWNRNGDWRRPVPEPKYERAINWRMYEEFSGGLLAELTSHQLDYVHWLFDERPTRVVGSGGIDYWKDGRETLDNTHCVYDYPSRKVTATCLTANAHAGYRIELRGSRGTIVLGTENAVLFREPLNPREEAAQSGQAIDGVSGASRTVAGASGSAGEVIEASVRRSWGGSHYALAAFHRSITEGAEVSSNARAGARSALAVRMGIDAVRGAGLVYWQSQWDNAVTGSLRPDSHLEAP